MTERSQRGGCLEGNAAEKAPAEALTGSWTGRSISNYAVAELIGVGGMGEVYRAKDRKLARDVAFKVLPASFGGIVTGSRVITSVTFVVAGSM